MSFSTVPDALRASADAAKRTADAVRTTDCAGLVGQIGGLMPGGAAAGAADELARSWRLAFDSWSGDMAGHGTKLIDAATTYVAVDEEARAGFEDGSHPTRGAY